MILRFLAGSVTFHLLYSVLKSSVVPACFSEEKSEAVIAEIAKSMAVTSEEKRIPSSDSFTSKWKATDTGRVVTIAFSTIVVVIGILVIAETYHDILYAKSQLLEYWVPTLMWYFIYDIYAMCDVSYLKIKSEKLTMVERIKKVIAMKRYFILHHLLTFLCSPLVFIYALEKGLGHMPFGCLCLIEISAPFVSSTYIMNLLHRTSSIWYTVIGACAVLSFTFRVLMVPLLYIYYGVQYGLGPVEVVTTMRLQCHVGCVAFTAVQIAWFVQIVLVTMKHLKKKSSIAVSKCD